MKYLLILFFVVCCYAVPHRNNEKSSYISSSLQEKLEKLRILMRVGDPDKGIPVMDPFAKDGTEFSMDTDNLKLDISATDIKLNGLSDFVVEGVDMSLVPITVTINVTMPLTAMTADHYKMNGLVFKMLPIYGDGQVHFGVGGLNVHAKAHVGVKLKGVYLKDMIIQCAVTHFESELTGVIGGGDIDKVVNALIEDLAIDFFNANAAGLNDMLSNIALKFGNEFLDGMSLQDLIDLITGYKNQIHLK